MPPTLTPVDYDPFAEPKGTPVDYDPFAPAAPARAAKPAKAPPPPLAGGQRGGALGYGMALGDQLWRTLGGAAADAVDGVTGLINNPIDAALRTAGVDFQFGRTNLGEAVPDPVGVVPQITRDVAPYVAGMSGLARAASTAIPKAVAGGAPAAPLAAGSIRTGIATGAPVDAAMSNVHGENLSNLIEEHTPLTLPTARRPDDAAGEMALKDMIEGGALGTVLEYALRGAGHALPGRAGPQRLDDAMGPADELPPAYLPDDAAPPARAAEPPPVAPGAAPEVPPVVMDREPVVEAMVEGRPDLGVGRAYAPEAEPVRQATPEEAAAADAAARGPAPLDPEAVDTALRTLPEETRARVVQVLEQDGVLPPRAAQEVAPAAQSTVPAGVVDGGADGVARSQSAIPPARAGIETPAGMDPASPRPAEGVDDVPPVGGRVAGAEPEYAATDVAQSRVEAGQQTASPDVQLPSGGAAKTDEVSAGGYMAPSPGQNVVDQGSRIENLDAATKAPDGQLPTTAADNAAAEPAVRLRGDEIAPPEADIKAVRAAAKDYFEKNLRGTSVRSEALGKDVKFLNPRKSLSTSAKPEKLRLFAALPEMIGRGRLLGSAPSKKGDQNIRAYHFLEADAQLGNQRHRVVINVREDSRGNVYYNHGLEDEAVPPANSRVRHDDGGGTPGARAADPGTTPSKYGGAGSEPIDNITPVADNPKGGTKLYSNPADPEAVKELLVDPAGRLLKKEIDGFKADYDQVRRDFAGLKGAATLPKAVDAVASAGRKVWWTNTAAIRSIGAKYKDVPEIRELADAVGTDPGRGRKIEQTFERAVQMRGMGMSNRLFNVLGDKVKPELETKIAGILAGRKTALRGTAEEEMARRVRKLLDEQHEYMTEAGLDVGYVKGRYYPRVIDEEKVLADPVGFKEKAAEVYRGMVSTKASEGADAPLPKMTPEEAEEAAEGWYARILGVTDGAYAAGTPVSKHTRGRTLPPEADEILKDFYQADPRANLVNYFRQTSRAAEFARRFGKNGEKADELFNAMLKKGVDARDVNSLRHHFESATGLLYSTRPDKGASALSWIQTAGVLRLLPRAVIASAAEGLATGIRAHDVGAGFKAMADSYKIVFGLDDAGDVRAAAEMLGVVGDAMNDLVLSAQFGGEVTGQLQQKVLARFFRTTHLHQITEAQRLAAFRVGQGMVRTLLEDVATGNARQKSASRLLNELGMDEETAQSVSRWLAENDGVPPIADLMGPKPEAKAYRTALQRFVDESIQNPTAADRPQWANHAFGRLAYGITSFMFSFTRNVLIRTGRETGEAIFGKGYTLEDRARLLTPAIALGVLVAAQSQVSELREMALSPGTRDEKSEQQKIVQNLSRAGVFGNADPFINIAMSARYERDLTSTLTGPYLTAYLDSISKMTLGLIPKDWGGPNTPNTNNAEWQASKAAYEMIAAPLIAAAASYAPGGPALRVGYGAGIVTGTSPGAARGFADSVAGERTVKPRGDDVARSRSKEDSFSTWDDGFK